ncbi:hypothetical protein B602_1029 [Chlamydia psittaci M56]|nr:hypothetical protein B602_1029 [Chlamydia psittaci M56]
MRLPVTNKGAEASMANLLKAKDEDQIKAVKNTRKIDMKK